jgi:hypothetical protein
MRTESLVTRRVHVRRRDPQHSAWPQNARAFPERSERCVDVLDYLAQCHDIVRCGRQTRVGQAALMNHHALGASRLDCRGIELQAFRLITELLCKSHEITVPTADVHETRAGLRLRYVPHVAIRKAASIRKKWDQIGAPRRRGLLAERRKPAVQVGIPP